MFFETFFETLRELMKPIFTIGLVLGFAFIANYSGMSSTLGLAFAATGALFPFFSPFLGWLGVFLTGSDTSSNALFANLQAVTAQQIGVNPILTIGANTTGGVTGKMISPQSIAVACAAVGLVGKESDLFRFTLKHSLFFALLIAIITYIQAYYLPWMIPVARPIRDDGRECLIARAGAISANKAAARRPPSPQRTNLREDDNGHGRFGRSDVGGASAEATRNSTESWSPPFPPNG